MEKEGTAKRLVHFRKNEYSFIPTWRASRGEKLKGKAKWAVTIWWIGHQIELECLTETKKELEAWKRMNTRASSTLVATLEKNK